MKRLLSILLVTVLLMTMSPVTGLAKGSEPSSDEAAGSSQITVEYFCSNGAYLDTVTALINEFNAGDGKKKGVYIKLVSEIENPTNVMEQKIAAGNYPDIFTSSSLNLEWYSRGFYKNLYDIDDSEIQNLIAAAQPHIDESFDTFGVSNDNFLCTLPKEVVPIKMVINLDLFAEAGVDEPKTWDDVLDAAEKITNLNKEATKGFGWTTWTAVWRRLTFKATIPSARKAWWDPNTGTYDWSQYRPVIEAICTMYQNGWMLGADDLGIDPIRSEFAAGHVGMFVSPSYDYNVYTYQFPASCNWKFIDMPVFNTGNAFRGCYYSQGGSAIFARSYDSADQAKKDAIEAAYAFVEGDKFVKACAEAGGLIPFPGRITDLDYSKQNPQYAQMADVEGYTSVPVFPDSLVTPYLEGENYARTFNSVMHGEISLDDALQDLSDRYNAAYAAAKADPDNASRISAYEYYYNVADNSPRPVITTQPKSQTVAMGESVSFTVKATGATKYQWYYRTSGTGTWTVVYASSGKTSNYTLTAQEKHNGYQYRCKVSNSGGSLYTEICTLTVITTKPEITTQPKNQTVVLGDTAKFTVKASGASGYQWYYRTSSTGSWTAVSASSGKTASYTLTAKEKHNGYQYRCKLTNTFGSVYTSARTLTVVISPPSITTQPADKSVVTGETAAFTLKAGGAGLTYQWYYRTSGTGTWTAVSASSGKTDSYSMTAQERHNGYQYRCKVSNPMGYVYSKICTLTVLPTKPVITAQPKDQVVALGDTAVFEVKATGATSYKWYYRTSSSGSWTAISADSGKTAVFILATAARHDGYQYRCKVTNSVGSVYTSARTLTVVTDAPVIVKQPTDQTVSPGSEVTFTLKASGRGLSYQWYYRASGTGSWTAVSADSGKTASYTMTAQSRHNGYQYRCKVTNALGSVYANIVTLTVGASSNAFPAEDIY